MQPFEKLSYRGKTGRFRQLVMTALLRYPMEVASVHLIEGYTRSEPSSEDNHDGDCYFIRVCDVLTGAQN